MINPTLDVLLKRVDCKYTLAVFAAKRAREIVKGDKLLIESQSDKPVTIALEEIANDKIGYQRTKNGIK
ncbi:rna polymerase subunit omega/k/rpb6 [Lucifera butyrica]|uniref:DNA-directed RNA polymerase subunit omega n=1 Tax=Lucifera butyrica TaxID=1351585 RepID=A0A498RCT3_9FIRM|nr:DNA-directed RNA polymerase subunit omega [Lucifera butyrica]VBB09354.1 rna polymerase subunit omega/k/rpb6 [Lucifera butyrica]